MKKLLFLPLAAMLCFGCSKEVAQAENPGVAMQNANQTINLIFYNEVDNSSFINDSYIEYEDASGQRQTYYPEEGMLSHFLTARENTMLTIHAKIRHKDAGAGGGDSLCGTAGRGTGLRSGFI